MRDIERLGGTTNAVLVQLPERANPGVVIQGDSMDNLLALVRNARECVSQEDWEEVTGLLEELDEILSGYVQVFPANLNR